MGLTSNPNGAVGISIQGAGGGKRTQNYYEEMSVVRGFLLHRPDRMLAEGRPG